MSGSAFWMATSDPELFDWIAFIVLPSVVGAATVVIAITAVVIAVQANRRAAEARDREARASFARAFIQYVEDRTYETAMRVQWPAAMTDDEATERIPVWLQEQLGQPGVSKDILTTSVEMRLLRWVKSGQFDDSPISRDGGGFIAL